MYPLLQGEQRQHGMRTVPDTSRHDQLWDLNPSGMDLESNAWTTWWYVPKLSQNGSMRNNDISEKAWKWAWPMTINWMIIPDNLSGHSSFYWTPGFTVPLMVRQFIKALLLLRITKYPNAQPNPLLLRPCLYWEWQLNENPMKGS